MDFPFNVNRLLPDSITKLTGDVQSYRYGDEMTRLLDTIGEASRLAQGLNRPVTSARSFIGSNQALFIMTNPAENNGNGVVLGLLKTGPKKLFLLNRMGSQNELTPTCVLDFYIHESCQRMGLGKMLFNHFLQTEKISNIQQLAIDRPSDKFLGFLRKHYGLWDMIPQVNNFVIFEGFFGSETGKDKCDQNNSFNRWNSMINVSHLDPYRGRAFQPQHQQSRLFGENGAGSSCRAATELWRATSMADMSVQNTHTVSSPRNDRPDASVSKFSHHRLW